MSSNARKPKPRDPWKVATGHRPHITGAGTHDPRPNRARQRGQAKRRALADW